MPMDRHPGTHTVIYVMQPRKVQEYRSKGRNRLRKPKWVLKYKRVAVRVPFD